MQNHGNNLLKKEVFELSKLFVFDLFQSFQPARFWSFPAVEKNKSARLTAPSLFLKAKGVSDEQTRINI